MQSRFRLKLEVDPAFRYASTGESALPGMFPLGPLAGDSLLSHESHRYLARESVLHALAEMVAWMYLHLRRAVPELHEAGTPAP